MATKGKYTEIPENTTTQSGENASRGQKIKLWRCEVMKLRSCELIKITTKWRQNGKNFKTHFARNVFPHRGKQTE